MQLPQPVPKYPLTARHAGLNAALSRLSDSVITPLRRSLDPDLWPGSDGNHVNGSDVFILQRAAVESLSELIVGPTQLAYIHNLVMADWTQPWRP